LCQDGDESIPRDDVCLRLLSEDDQRQCLDIAKWIIQVITVVCSFVSSSFLQSEEVSVGVGFWSSDDKPVLLGWTASFVDAWLFDAGLECTAVGLPSLVLVVEDNLVVRLANALSKAAS